MKASVYIATSLDGFIARENGAIDWLPEASSNESEGDYGYKAFMDTVDALIMGRKTFEQALTFGKWPYENKAVVVLSHNTVQIPKRLPRSVESMSCSPPELISRLSARGVGHVYVDGGKTIQGFLNAGLIQAVTITRIPILLGSGIPLFGPLERDIHLRHTETRPFSNGFVQSKYEVR